MFRVCKYNDMLLDFPPCCLILIEIASFYFSHHDFIIAKDEHISTQTAQHNNKESHFLDLRISFDVISYVIIEETRRLTDGDEFGKVWSGRYSKTPYLKELHLFRLKEEWGIWENVCVGELRLKENKMCGGGRRREKKTIVWERCMGRIGVGRKGVSLMMSVMKLWWRVPELLLSP